MVFTGRVTVQDLAARLPEPDELRATSRAFAVLDAAFALEYAKYSFTTVWQPGVDLARMDNGSGDHWDIVFEPAGVFLYGFDREIDAKAVRAIFAGEPLTAEIVHALNPAADFAAVAKIAELAGYPVTGTAG